LEQKITEDLEKSGTMKLAWIGICALLSLTNGVLGADPLRELIKLSKFGK